MNDSIKEYRSVLHTGTSGIIFIALVIMGLLMGLWPAFQDIVSPFWQVGYFPLMMAYLAIIAPLEVRRRRDRNRRTIQG